MPNLRVCECKETWQVGQADCGCPVFRCQEPGCSYVFVEHLEELGHYEYYTEKVDS